MNGGGFRLRRMTLPALVAVVALLAAACGQKPGVSQGRSLPDIILETGAAAATGPAAPGDPAAPGPGGTTTTTVGGEDVPAGEDAPAAPGAQLVLSGSDRTGVTDDSLTFGVHAPVTGAAPLPATSFEQSRDLYWRWLTEIEGRTVLGRSSVNVLFQDDRYAPSTAVQSCRQLASSSFMLVGGGGADGISACARFADQSNVPYLSNGVSEAGLRGLDWYFAVAMSYPAQAELLAQYVTANFGNARTAAIILNTPGFDDAVDAWEGAVARHGVNYFRTIRHDQGTSAWIPPAISDLRSEGVEVVFILTAPVFYLEFAQQAADQGLNPQFVGVGVTMGLNTILGTGCSSAPNIDGAVFFSPWPGMDWVRQNVPEFFDSGSQLGVPTDDLAFALWQLARTQHEILDRYEQVYGSNDLTREDFRNMLEQQQGIQTGIGPQLSFTPDDHFGASQVNVLRANCATEEYETAQTFASGF
jgi:ABC-type branched-subunit amino acid transport system substrate-binding protein